MKKTITLSDFVDEFNNSSRKNSFTYDGLKALYEYFEEIDDGMELDIVAIDCEYTEYSSATEAASEYFEFEGMTFGEDGEELESEEKVEQKARDFLDERTQLIVFSTGVIIANF